MVTNKIKTLLLGVFALSVFSPAQIMKVWKDGVATEYYMPIQVDSVTFDEKLILNEQSCIYDSIASTLDSMEKTYSTVVIGNFVSQLK